MTNVFVLFAFSQPSDTNGCWKRSKMKNLSWTQTALLRLGCLSLIWETEKLNLVFVFAVCLLNLNHITVALCKLGGRTHCSVALFEETFVFLGEVQAYLEGMRLIVAAKTLDQQMNKFYPQAQTISASRAEQSRLSSSLSGASSVIIGWI